MIRAPRFSGSALAARLGEQVTEFNAVGAATKMDA